MTTDLSEIIIKASRTGRVASGPTFVLSDATVDRYGDIVEPGGWDLRQFKRNPIALFGHRSDFPIGTWENIRVDDGQLMADFAPAKANTSFRVNEILSLIEQGILRAASVGFRPMKSEPLNPDDAFGPRRYQRQELLETSIVSVPANPAALSLAKSMNISDETIALAFGKHAAMRHRVMATGKHAAHATRSAERPRGMTTRNSERIQELQTGLVTKEDELTGLQEAEGDDFDVEAVERTTAEIATIKRELTAREASEQATARQAAGLPAVIPPTQQRSTSVMLPRRPIGQAVVPAPKMTGLDLAVKAGVVNVLFAAHGGKKTLDQIVAERYGGDELVAMVVKADQTIGTTTVSGWASELVPTRYSDSIIEPLQGRWVYGELINRGQRLSFDGNGTVSIPSYSDDLAGATFVAEGEPIRVGRITTAATTVTAKKVGVIIPFTWELARRSTPEIESIVRRAILTRTARGVDVKLLSADAATAAAPAGLLNGVSAVASGAGGGDYQAVIDDINALLAPFDTANASDGIVIVMHPQQARKLRTMPGPDGTFGWVDGLLEELTIIRSTHAMAGRLIAIRAEDFATAAGDSPEFDVSQAATIHMEDAAPLEIVSGTGPTTADPVRSLWQTGGIAVRMLQEMTWKMTRSGMIQWIDGVSW